MTATDTITFPFDAFEIKFRVEGEYQPPKFDETGRTTPAGFNVVSVWLCNVRDEAVICLTPEQIRTWLGNKQYDDLIGFAIGETQRIRRMIP